MFAASFGKRLVSGAVSRGHDMDALKSVGRWAAQLFQRYPLAFVVVWVVVWGLYYRHKYVTFHL